MYERMLDDPSVDHEDLGFAIQQALDNRALRRDNFDACMAARGYVRRVLSYNDDKALGGMTAEEKAARLAEMAAAPNPSDRIAKDR